MKSCIVLFIGLMLSVSVSAEPLLEGRVRLESGQHRPPTRTSAAVRPDQSASVGQHHHRPDRAFHPVAASLCARHRCCRKALPLGQNYPNPFNPSTVSPLPKYPPPPTCAWKCSTCWGNGLTTLVDRRASRRSAHRHLDGYRCGRAGRRRRGVHLSAQQRRSHREQAHGAH